MAVYAIFALAATARAAYQIYDDFHSAPVAYLLSAFSAVVYIVATVCLVRASRLSHHIAVISCAIEFVGVIVVGFLSIFAPNISGNHRSGRCSESLRLRAVVLPVLGLLWLRHTARRVTEPGRLSS